jgi:hypothetical protein
MLPRISWDICTIARMMRTEFIESLSQFIDCWKFGHLVSLSR